MIINLDKIKIFSAILLFFTSFTAWAVKAKPGVISYTEPDGSTIEIILHGDDHFHYATTIDGYLLLPNKDDFYEFAVLNSNGVPSLSGVRVSKGSFRSDFVRAEDCVNLIRSNRDEAISVKNRTVHAGDLKYRYSTSAFPTTGSPHSLVILVEYPDYGFNVENPKEYFEEFLNGENFTADRATGSCREFYIDNSNGSFIPTFDIYGPVMLKNNRSYYGRGDETNACQMVVEAVEYLDDIIDFTQYDHNDDGYVDSIYIIYSDKGEADGGPRDSVWPYSWELEEEGVSLSADGVKFNTYGVSNELQVDGEMVGIGTFTHEFGHVLGLPDLYNTYNAYDNSTPNEWSVMDSGSYNNDSRTPCNFSSFERYSLGWLQPDEIVASGEYTIPELSGSNRAFIMTTEEDPDEFFMAEYRNHTGWDAYLPATGMLIWHIQFNQKAWDENTVNNTSSHHYVDLLRADNTTSKNSYAGDPYPGSKEVTEINATTKPALLSWGGNALNVLSLSEIQEIDKEYVTFKANVSENRVPAGIDDVKDENDISISGNIISIKSGICDIYDLSGRRVATLSPDSPAMLDKGIYIAAGRKILIK